MFYQDQHGKSDVLEFISSLPVVERAKIDFVLRLLKIYGLALKMPYARQLEGKLWELRPGSTRLLYFAYIRQQFVVLHGFRKKTNKTPRREIELARNRMEQLLEEV